MSNSDIFWYYYPSSSADKKTFTRFRLQRHNVHFQLYILGAGVIGQVKYK